MIRGAAQRPRLADRQALAVTQSATLRDGHDGHVALLVNVTLTTRVLAVVYETRKTSRAHRGTIAGRGPTRCKTRTDKNNSIRPDTMTALYRRGHSRFQYFR